ncbi:MAG TPA: glycosyltransferase [Candidatus Baltobacteraceae bacterium]|jgi:glycosyltransferase involved in cell wall biosynthesis
MRVGFFTEVYRPVVNGIVASIDGLAEGLRARGHEVYCFAPKVPGYVETDGPVFRMPSLPLPMSTPYRLTIPLVSRRNRIGVIKKLSIIHAHSPFVTGWMAQRYARRYGIPFVYTYHTRLEEYAHYVPFDEHATRFAATQLTRNFANLADTVIVPTLAMRDRLLELGVTRPVEIVPSGIDLRFFGSGTRRREIREGLGVREGDRLLLFVSRLAREKNVDLLLDALARSADPTLRLVLAGDGPERAPIEERVRDLGLSGQVSFAGGVERVHLPDLYASADAFVFPSVSETQGLVLAEALAAGAFVIAAEAPQSRDVLGGAGVVAAADPAAFAAAFLAVPKTPDPAVDRRAREAATRFGLDEQTEHVETLYERLLTREPEAVGS